MFDARGVVRSDDESDVVELSKPEDNLRVVVGGRVGPLLTRERDDDARVVFARRGRYVSAVLARDFDARPFAPEVDARRGLHDFRDVRATDARRRLKKIEAAVAALYELCVRDPAREPERANEFVVERVE